MTSSFPPAIRSSGRPAERAGLRAAVEAPTSPCRCATICATPLPPQHLVSRRRPCLSSPTPPDPPRWLARLNQSPPHTWLSLHSSLPQIRRGPATSASLLPPCASRALACPSLFHTPSSDNSQPTPPLQALSSTPHNRLLPISTQPSAQCCGWWCSRWCFLGGAACSFH